MGVKGQFARKSLKLQSILKMISYFPFFHNIMHIELRDFC